MIYDLMWPLNFWNGEFPLSEWPYQQTGSLVDGCIVPIDIDLISKRSFLTDLQQTTALSIDQKTSIREITGLNRETVLTGDLQKTLVSSTDLHQNTSYDSTNIISTNAQITNIEQAVETYTFEIRPVDFAQTLHFSTDLLSTTSLATNFIQNKVFITSLCGYEDSNGH